MRITSKPARNQKARREAAWELIRAYRPELTLDRIDPSANARRQRLTRERYYIRLQNTNPEASINY